MVGGIAFIETRALTNRGIPMTTTIRTALTFCGTLLLVAALHAEALALDGYWHGVRSTAWGDGVSGGTSNWYDMAPAAGNPVGVPDDRAIFAPGAQRLTVEVKKKQSIKSIEYAAGNDTYQIMVLDQLSVTGLGITNSSSLVQAITAKGKQGRLFFRNTAVAGLLGIGTQPIYIYNDDSAETRFYGQSNASNTKVINRKGGLLAFYDRSSAGDAELINSRPKSEIHFLGKSTGSIAKIDNIKGTVFVDSLKAKSLPIRRITNNRKFIVGDTQVKVSDTMTLQKRSRLHFYLGKNKAGKVSVANAVTLAGKLQVIGSASVKKGQYVLVDSGQKISGKFKKKVAFLGFTKKQKPKVSYKGKKVILKVN
jgi:hypothetical protein